MKGFSKVAIFLVLILLIVALFFLFRSQKIGDDYDFSIYFFNAGKADAIVLSQNNHYVMIDTGEESLSDDILKYFQSHNIEKLDYLIITHFDKDHVGGASTILDKIEVGEVLQSNVRKDSEYYEHYIASLESKGITPVVVSDNYSVSFGDVQGYVNGPTTTYEKNESNNSSLIVSLTYGENHFLFMGDAQNARIRDYNKIDTVSSYDFLKVPYHGHYLSKLDNLLSSKNISYAVITSSDSEMEDAETLELLKSYHISYYLTREGSITVYSNGKKLQIKQ